MSQANPLRRFINGLFSKQQLEIQISLEGMNEDPEDGL